MAHVWYVNETRIIPLVNLAKFIYYEGMKVFKLGEDILRQKAVEVERIDEEITNLIEQMFETMYDENGIGLAGPQIGKNLRIFVIELDDEVRRVFINPQIISTSQETSFSEEGCLSIPGVYAEIERPAKITIQALNETGKMFTVDADGLLARAIQHEYDHLEGILFIDRGDTELKEKTIESFAKKQERKLKKEAEKKAKQAKLASKLAAKEAKVQGK